MKLKKTDKRFKLYQFGFDCFLEFANYDFKEVRKYMMYRKMCQKVLGEQFTHFHSRVYTDGKYYLVNKHRNTKGYNTKRIYFKGEKNYTFLEMYIPADQNVTFYL